MNLETKLEGLVDNSVRKGSVIGFLIVLLRKLGISQFIRKIWIRIIYHRDSNNPTNEMIESVRFFEEHKEEVEKNLLLLSDDKSKEVYKKAIKFRCTHKLKDFPVYNSKNQYFDKDIIPMKDDYVFVDGGSYTGDTIESFLKFCNKQYSRIICFEPDPKNVEALKKNTHNYNNVDIIEKGLWSDNTILHFSLDQTASKVSNDGDIVINVTNIDNVSTCSEANFIKMDIEGSELNALNGAKKTIYKNHPILAICIYHSNEDMIEIIKWINDLGIDYNLYVRHHSFDIHETVLYAIPRN